MFNSQVYKFNVFFFSIFPAHCQTFFCSTFFRVNFFYYRRFVHVSGFPIDVFLLVNILSQSTFFDLQSFVPVGVFSIQCFVPFYVFSFEVLSLDAFYRWRFLLGHFVIESLQLHSNTLSLWSSGFSPCLGVQRLASRGSTHTYNGTRFS